ncbi:MAG TPA: adenylate/guanylate cyclase domain-containing protein [Beijerinckiaceae bacterium]|nr:adenylate/guanylate cyclase domain-containing protein [Beijerinckiaceae bacterium]
MRIAAPDGSVGVVTADFHLEVLEAFLAALRVGGGGRAAILVPQLGEAHAVLGGSSLPPAMAAALNQALLGTAKPAGRIVHEDASGAAIALDMRAFDLGNGRPWLLAVMMSAEEIEGPIRRATRDTLLVAAAFLLFGVAAAAWISAVITRPIRAMSEDLARVGELELTGAPPRTFIRELDRMGRSLSAMKAALRSFARYVPVEIVRGPLLSGREAEPGGELRDVTVLFTDIEGFTRIAEALGPERSMQELAGYFEVLEEAVAAQGGVIDKYMGDGAMVLFNAPTPLADHAARACAAALRFQAGLDALNRTRAAQGLPPFRTRMGLATGPAVVGNFGTARRMAYTAIGDVVNVASRLEPLNDVYGTGILADAGVRAAAGEGFAWRRLDRIALVGRAEPVELYELVPAGTGAAEAPRTLGRAA